MFFPGAKRSGTVADHPPPTSAKVKNEWHFTSNSFICLRGLDGENFILYRIGVLRDDESLSNFMIVPNIDCCVGPYCYRVAETCMRAAATAALHSSL